MTVTLTGLITWTRPSNPNLYLLVKISAGLLFMIFIVESDSLLLTAPIISHLGIDRDFIATAIRNYEGVTDS